MDYHGQRFLTVRQFQSRARALNLRFLSDRELEFYEQHCLLLPVARTRMPRDFALAQARAQLGASSNDPEAIGPPDAWRRLHERATDGAHGFDRERGRNPSLVTPDCTTFEAWGAHRVAVTMASGDTVQVPTVERYYAYWQVHAVDFLRRAKYYERAPLLRALPESSPLRDWYRLPVDSEPMRTLHGKAAGYEALTLFGVAYEATVTALLASRHGDAPTEIDRDEFREGLRIRAQRILGQVSLDQSAFYDFVARLAELMQDYRRDERAALADDVERDLELAQQFAQYAFDHEWDDFIEATGAYWGAVVRRLDPVDAAIHGASQSVEYIVSSGLGVTATPKETGGLPQQIVDFCVAHDLFEVLSGLAGYFFTEEDLRRDRYPGFLHRRLRPLALAVEQLTRAVLDVAGQPHSGVALTGLLKTLGSGSAWLPQFNRFVSSGATSDKAGDLHLRVVALANSEATNEPDEVAIARTLVLAVAARNLVSHRHRFLGEEAVRTLTGACARSIVWVWLLARRRGVV